MENNKKAYKLVFNAGVARQLIRMGAQVADIKADRANPDKTVFVFKNDELFQKEFEKLNKEIAEARAAQEDDSE
jgi:hypothetical protein